MNSYLLVIEIVGCTCGKLVAGGFVGPGSKVALSSDFNEPTMSGLFEISVRYFVYLGEL